MRELNNRRVSGEATPFALILLLAVLAAAWLLWSGIYKPVVIGLGGFSCLLTLWLAVRMGFFENSSNLIRVTGRLPRFWLLLAGDILKSSWEVARIVLSRDLPVEPTLVRLKSTGKLEISQAILGNSITLSPGTVTLDVHEGELLVHCLTKSSAEGLADVDRRVAELEQQ